MGFLTEDLVKRSPFEYEKNEKQPGGQFYEALIEEICFHYDSNLMYRNFCDNKGFNPHRFNGELCEIPSVQVSVFKELGSKLNSVPREDIKLTLQSSATSGVPSSVPVDAITSKRQARSMIKVVGSYIGNERKPFLVMDVDPMSGFREILGARYAAVSGYLNFASEVGYFLKVNDNNTYYFDIDGIKSYIAGLGGKSAVVFGFTYILYSEVVRPLMEQGIRFDLPKGSKIIHIGGWKKLENEKISKEQFNKLTADLFGIEETDIIDIYGFTEQMGLNYPDCPCGCKHTPLYSEVIVRDVITKEVVEHGKEGLLEFVTPIPHSYPGNVVLTDDIGVIVPGKCQYNREGTRFKVIGRLKKAEIRGCGDILSSKIKFADNVTNLSKQMESTTQFRRYYAGKEEIVENAAEKEIQDIACNLKDNLKWLRRQPIDALIGLISQASKKWQETSEAFSVTQDQGLNFLISWCSPENLTRIANAGLRGNRKCVDGFIASDDNAVTFMKTTSRGLVCHWLAGNVQVLGMFVLIQSILTKNVNMLRVSSRDNGAFKALLSVFEDEVYTTKGGYTINGNDLLKTIAVVFFNHSNKKANIQMSMLADVRIAWGGEEAVSSVAAFPSKYDCEDIIMGPKLSMAVVAKESISDDRKAKKIARKLAVDASVFDQTGCASAHNVFVERGSLISPKEFAKYLADGMEKVSKQIPKGKMSPEEFAAVHSIRGIFDFKGTVYGDEDSVWTVLYDEKPELNKPVYSRVVFVHAIEKLDDVLQFITEDIQTIGLAANLDKSMKFAILASERGAIRFPALGKMLNFESPWDGMFIMERLVRWNTLGGPLV
ncbi:MAG: acyl-CoA reductase [Lachnospira sp.]|nr:acyl-CoA reductase [Lachnospira sp.]